MACHKRVIKNPLDAKLEVVRIDLNTKTHRKMRHRESPVRVYYCQSCGGHHLTSQARGVGVGTIDAPDLSR